jgi:hypothetical protein
VFSGAGFQIYGGVVTYSLSDDGTCQIADPSLDVERIVCEVVLRMARVEIHCKHEGLVLCLALKGRDGGWGGILRDNGLLRRLHCLLLENDHQPLYE